MKKKIGFILLLLIIIAGIGFWWYKSSQKPVVKDTILETQKEEEAARAPANNEDADKDYPQLSTKVAADETQVKLVTSAGVIEIKLFPTYAPNAVKSFLEHAKNGDYNGLTFHRVINDMMLQAGLDNDEVEATWENPYTVELSDQLYHIRGALSMVPAADGKIDSSQFYIIQNQNVDTKAFNAIHSDRIREVYTADGGTPWLDQVTTVFGQVISGMDVVDKIATTPVDGYNKPTTPIVIENIVIVE